MRLKDMISCCENEVVSIVGAGGKTSLVNYLADNNRNKYNVLLTTTTKIYVPDKKYYDEIYMIENTSNFNMKNNTGITVLGKTINNSNKIVGLSFSDLSKYDKNYNLILIESDGSKTKRLKGWRCDEPVVYEKTTKTIGVLDITTIGMKIDHFNIHRIEEFKKLISKDDSVIDINILKTIVLHENGLFKNAVGKKMLIINKVEDSYYERKAEELINCINNKIHNIEIFYGSIKYGYVYK